jgi:hypothetical protein
MISQSFKIGGGPRLADIETKTSSIETNQWFQKPFKLVGRV